MNDLLLVQQGNIDELSCLITQFSIYVPMYLNADFLAQFSGDCGKICEIGASDVESIRSWLEAELH